MSYSVQDVRAAFPSLSLRDDGRPRVYLDNPAGTQVPLTVMQAISDSFMQACANQGGYFRTSREADRIVDQAHRAMAEFLGTPDPSEIIIGPNSTTLTFQLSRSIGRELQAGDEVILTRMDHEANVAPWLEMAEERGLVVRWAEFDADSWRVELEHLRALITPKTRLLALNYASNLTGAVNDVPALVKAAKAAGLLVYVDAVQLAPHAAIDVVALGCDFLMCSPYKFFGPHLGVLWGRRSLLEQLHAYKCRSVSGELPGKFETGTPAIELQAGLIAAVEHFASLGAGRVPGASRREQIVAAFGLITEHERALTAQLLAGLATLADVSIIGPDERSSAAPRVPTVSVRHRRIAAARLAQALAGENIFVWSGHNYALGIVEQLGIPAEEGVLRIGAAHYNTSEEVEQTLSAIRRLVR